MPKTEIKVIKEINNGDFEIKLYTQEINGEVYGKCGAFIKNFNIKTFKKMTPLQLKQNNSNLHKKLLESFNFLYAKN